ncbi:MAG TPA: tetratricopeptide repeat protein [Nitrospiria bacterium]
MSAVTACEPTGGPRLVESPVGGMALEAPEGYRNKAAAGWNGDGIEHLRREHWKKAEADFGRALEADPNLAAAHFNIALALDQQERHAEAAGHFKAALELAPQDPRLSESAVLRKHLQVTPAAK